jgi:hypothetical protein
MSEIHQIRRLIMQALYFLALFPPILVILLTNSISAFFFSFLFVFLLVAIIQLRPKLKTIVLGIAIPISIVLNSELILRFKFNHLVPENIYTFKNGYYFNKPNLINPIVDDEYQTLYITDELGLRIPYPGYKHVNPNWVFFGDSYTQGAQVSYQQLYTTRLQEEFPNVKILNLGVSGFSLIEHKNIIMDYIKTHHPQRIFLQLCVLNDFLPLEKNENPHSNWLTESSMIYRLFQYNKHDLDSSSILNDRWVLPFSRLNEINLKYNILDKRNSKEKSSILRDFKKKIMSISKILKRKGIDFTVILIPTKEQVSKLYFIDVIKNFKIDPVNIDLNHTSKFVNTLVNKDVSVIDVLNDFRNSKELLYFQRDEHLNENGHKVLSKVIYTHLKTGK